MRYILDTNVILFYLRKNDRRQVIDRRFGPFKPENQAVISIVTVAEIKALAKKNRWGRQRTELAESFLQELIVIDIRYGELVELYAEIDAYSQGKLSGTAKFSARNMGKNDLWIAATTKLVDGQLLTTDHDFSHLDKAYFTVHTLN